MSLRMVTLMAAVGAAAGADSMSFLALGDWGGTSDQTPTAPGEVDNNKGMGKVADSLGGVRFVMAMGDNFYSAGIDTDVHSPRFQSTYENVFTSPNLQVPWYAIAGNHDHKGNVTAQIAYTQLSKRWTFPALHYTFTESFVTSSGKNVSTQVIYIDTVLFAGQSYRDDATGEFVHYTGTPDAGLLQMQREWLQETLAKSQADYLWVSGHYPIYSHCSHGPTADLIAMVLPLLKQYNASGYLAGHDHCQGHYIVDDKALVLAGAGKECCYDPTNINKVPSGSMKFRMDSQNTYGAKGGFASLTVTATETTIKYYDTTGKVLYTAAPVYPRK
eukprot:TRINITY_DN594_c0_g1_i1.p1 TRINITY_DN594_c0_g1~~TRINITY_DN594_c0_g1_i1.p1  ORF type:complete len:330 (+),score=120.28 TRINITY_DN594_c0_g1_i1:39-1028(+)